MTRLAIALAAVVLTGIAVPAVTRPARDQDPDREALMREKLELAQKVLAGLSKNDLPAAATDGAALAALVREARWRISETPGYLARSAEFERAAATLSSMAANKNAEGAALAWVQVTTQCFDCHRWVRDTRKPR
jgi:hypothetical protein